MVYTDHDQRHESDGTGIAENVNEDLNHRLSDIARDRLVKVLDGKEEPASDRSMSALPSTIVK